MEQVKSLITGHHNNNDSKYFARFINKTDITDNKIKSYYLVIFY